LDMSPVQPDPALLSASKEAPFVNSLGMKFVPVPGTNVLFCTTETTVAQYQLARLGYVTPTFQQGSNHPAVNVSWYDAKAWCAWLSQLEGRKYRIPTDAEWNTAQGTSSTYPWGESWPPPNNYGNYAGQEMRSCTETERALIVKNFEIIAGFSDQHKFTAPVGSYAANHYGIYDLGSNVSEWCEDPYSVTGCRTYRSAAWNYSLRLRLECSYNDGIYPEWISWDRGFRCVVVR